MPEAADTPPAEALAVRLEQFARMGGLPATLSASGIEAPDLAGLAAIAAEQWTGTFNPRPFDAGGALEIYKAAL